MEEQIKPMFYHKQATSARLTFLHFSREGICGMGGLPHLAEVIDENDADGEDIVLHPSVIARRVASSYGLTDEDIVTDAGFRATVDIPGGPVNVYLLRFTRTDPPMDLADRLQARFITLTEARGLPPAEMELLRRAYTHVLG